MKGLKGVVGAHIRGLDPETDLNLMIFITVFEAPHRNQVGKDPHDHHPLKGFQGPRPPLPPSISTTKGAVIPHAAVTLHHELVECPSAGKLLPLLRPKPRVKGSGVPKWDPNFGNYSYRT